MKILIACEFSGIVREEFKKLGHEAWSCDLLDTVIPGKHIKGDALRYLVDAWDMLIAFPPCTNLASSGARYFKQKQLDGRQQESIDFFMKFINAPINKIAVENPVGIMSTKYRKPDQIIQPYNFGEDASKSTCLWLKNLPPLVGQEYVEPRIINGKKRWGNQTDSGQNKLSQSKNRALLRSITYQGIAKAMAVQWG
jgi:hypothetical protein